MKILIVYRHFWPDSPPYATMLRSIGARLVADGHQVTLWCEMPCYKLVDGSADSARTERVDGVTVHRLSRLPGWQRFGGIRMLDKLAFVPRIVLRALFARLCGKRFDLVWTASIPPVAQGWAGRMIARLFGADTLYHCQDLYPEIAIETGLWKADSATTRVLRAIEARTRQRCDWLVTLSDDMRRTAVALARPRHVAIINNFMLESFDQQAADGDDNALAPAPMASNSPSRSREPDILHIGFAGNIGRFQGLDEVVAAMRMLGPDAPVRLTLMGDGAAKTALRAAASGLDTVRFTDHRPFEQARTAIARFDLGLVSVEPGVYKVAYPSKTLTYLGLGIPIFALIEDESELAQMITNECIGATLASRDPAAIAAALFDLASDRHRFVAMRDTARALYHRQLSRAARLDQWSELMRDIENAGGAAA